MSIPSINQKTIILKLPTHCLFQALYSQPCIPIPIPRRVPSIQPNRPSETPCYATDLQRLAPLPPIAADIPFIIVSGIVITKTGSRSGRPCDPVLCPLGRASIHPSKPLSYLADRYVVMLPPHFASPQAPPF